MISLVEMLRIVYVVGVEVPPDPAGKLKPIASTGANVIEALVPKVTLPARLYTTPVIGLFVAEVPVLSEMFPVPA